MDQKWIRELHVSYLLFTTLPTLCVSELLISSYGAPLAQRAFYLTLPQFSLWASGAVNYGIHVHVYVGVMMDDRLMNSKKKDNVHNYDGLLNFTCTCIYVCNFKF